MIFMYKLFITGFIRYSEYNKKSIQVAEVKDSQADKIKKMEARIKELELAAGQKQMNIDYLEKMIDLAKEHDDIDIKKTQSTHNLALSRSQRKIDLQSEQSLPNAEYPQTSSHQT